MKLSQASVVTELGPLYLVASEVGLRGVYWDEQPGTVAASNAVLRIAVKQLVEYFSRRRQAFDLPLELEGTPFQKRVWERLCQIPYGQTCSYKDVAASIKNPQAVRAVGGANGKNPLCVVVPCHRVIAADGGIGGYTGGLEIKRYLIELERGNRASVRSVAAARISIQPSAE
ncbi:MAG: hypothetical protein RJA70_2623 [Pseudomonadota bacterium]|jgi:methylated-DNA-[protein]-cysteine S-methyltransferase